MKKDNPQKSKSFFENNSWYHRIKILQADGTVKYSKKGGLSTSKEADKSYDMYEADFKKAYRAYQMANKVNTEVMFKDYLVYWFEEILNLALKEAVIAGYIKNNPVTGTKPYKRRSRRLRCRGKKKQRFC